MNFYFLNFLTCTVLTKVMSVMKEENWTLLLMYSTVVDLRRFAAALDNRVGKNVGAAKAGEHLTRTAELIMDLFRVCAGDR